MPDPDADVDVLVIGGGQAGLAAGHDLRQRGLELLILDAHARTGDSWRERWDSLELFTPKPLAALPGLPYDRSVPFYPHRDDVADYLQAYASHFDLPIRHSSRVRSLRRGPAGFEARSDGGTVRSRCVVVAAGPFTTPRIPQAAADGLDPDVVQIHTSRYRNADEVPRGRVLVVGGGNSAAQIAEELSETRDVTLASRGPLIMSPRSVAGVSIFKLMKLTGYLRIDKDTKLARYARPYSDTIIGLGLRRAISTNRVRHVPSAVVAAAGREIEFEDGSRRPFDAVVWGTGFRPSYPWIEVDGALGPEGEPDQDRGRSAVPGLFWLGLAWQTRLDSALLTGVGADAADIGSAVVDHLESATSTA